MARRRKSKIQPAVQTMAFAFNVDAGSQLNYIDLSQCASIMNRRFYRQGLNWAVSGIKTLTVQSGQIVINKLPNTWVMSNAWEKCFRAWKKQQDDALDETDQQSIKARFNDFKIFADEDHLRNGVAANLLPIDGAVNLAAPGEWQMSQIVIPNWITPGNNIEPYIYGVGGYDLTVDPTQFGLIEAYANSRAVPQSPDPVTPAGVASATANVFKAMFDVGDNSDQVMDNAMDKNDDLPYLQTDYPGGDNQLPALERHSGEYVTTTTIGGTTRFKGGNFPCGLICIGSDMDSATTIYLEIDLVPGMHRGYLAEPMTEM